MKVKELIAKLQEFDGSASFWKGLFLGYVVSDVILTFIS